MKKNVNLHTNTLSNSLLNKTQRKNSYRRKSIQPIQLHCGLLKNKKCHVHQLNGVEDHIHIITSVHPSIALSDLVKDIKVASSKMIKEEELFPRFKGWQTGYGAFTYSIDAKDNLIEYVKNQKEHHNRNTFTDE